MKTREIWVDNVKVIACVLVVLGHFYQSMTKAGILPAGELFLWFNQTIYYFHVPLFFIFLITPTFRSRKMAGTGLAVATGLKALGIMGGMEWSLFHTS